MVAPRPGRVVVVVAPRSRVVVVDVAPRLKARGYINNEAHD